MSWSEYDQLTYFELGELVALLEEEAKEQGGGSGPASKSIKQAPAGGTVNRTRM